MTNLEICRAYEIVTLLLFLASWLWLWKMRNPVYLGSLIGATLVYGYDWVYTTKFFFNATFNHALIWIPFLDIMGIREPLSIPFAYGMAFGPFVVALVMLQGWFDRSFGVWHYLVVWLIGGIGVMCYEVPVVHILHIWTYHQRPAYLLWGVPISDLPLAGNLILISYAGVRWLERWAQIPAGAGFSATRETTWKGIVMGGLAPWAAFYITMLLQMFWYSYAHPWVDVGRPF